MIKTPYKFSSTATETIPAEATAVKYYLRLEKGGRLSRDEKNELFEILMNNSGKSDYRVLGWVFPFAQFFKTYLVKYNHNGNKWIEVRAPDKTAIRNCYLTNGGIVKIIELPE